MRLAIVMTIRNERAILRANLLYHYFAGIDKIYLYDDQSTDNSAKSVADLPFVTISPTVNPGSLRNKPRAQFYIDNFNQIAARQSLNVMHAIDRARDDHINWLIHMDADELIATQNHNAQPGRLKQLFNSVSENIQCIHFKPYEVCSRHLEYENAFAQETLFTPHNAKGKRQILNPFTNKPVLTNLTLGHRAGKHAIRIPTNLIPHGPHRFIRPDNSRPATINRAFLLHYYLPDFPQFIHKFTNIKNQPDILLHGKPLNNLKQLWRNMVNNQNFTENQLKSYFRNNLLTSETEVKQRTKSTQPLGIPLRKPTLIKITTIQNAFQLIKDPHHQPNRTIPTELIQI